ncbi:uncharacterized protein F5891DRAFT_956530, partial [Suillus fuscotomentosus]
LEQKIHLLTFASLGFAHIGCDLEVTSILQIESSQVKKWVINGMSRLLLTSVIKNHLPDSQSSFGKSLADHLISTHLLFISAHV